MIIDNERIVNKSLKAIAQAKDCLYFRVLSTGELQINNYFKSYVFLAYVRGHWYTSFGNRKGSSISIPETGLDLFAYGNNSLWIQNDNKEVDISNPVIPLDKDTRVALFAFFGGSYRVILADGNEYSTVVSTELKKEHNNVIFLVLTLNAMIRQYDEKSADEIAQFWFHNDDADNSNPLIPNCEDSLDPYKSKTEEAPKEHVNIEW